MNEWCQCMIILKFLFKYAQYFYFFAIIFSWNFIWMGGTFNQKDVSLEMKPCPQKHGTYRLFVKGGSAANVNKKLWSSYHFVSIMRFSVLHNDYSAPIVVIGRVLRKGRTKFKCRFERLYKFTNENSINFEPLMYCHKYEMMLILRKSLTSLELSHTIYIKFLGIRIFNFKELYQMSLCNEF